MHIMSLHVILWQLHHSLHGVIFCKLRLPISLHVLPYHPILLIITITLSNYTFSIPITKDRYFGHGRIRYIREPESIFKLKDTSVSLAAIDFTSTDSVKVKMMTCFALHCIALHVCPSVSLFFRVLSVFLTTDYMQVCTFACLSLPSQIV